jgi:PAS domain S-box-containing protein
MKSQKIGIRLGMAFGVLVIILMGIGYMGLNRMAQIGANLNEVLARETKLQLSRTAMNYSNRNSRITMEILLQGDKPAPQLLTEKTDNSRRVSELIEQIESQCDTDREKKLLATIKQLRASYTQSYLRVLQLYGDEHKRDTARAMAQETLQTLFAYHAAWSQFVKFQMEQVDQAAKESRAHYAATRRVVLSLIVLAGVTAVGISTFATRKTAQEMATRMRAENEINTLNLELEQRVAQRTSELAAANKRLTTEIQEHNQAETRRRQAEERCHKIVEEAIIGIFQSTPDRRYLRVNPAMAHMFGYDSPEDMVASITSIPEQTYVEPDKYERLRFFVEELGVVRNVEQERCRKDGSKIWVSMHVRVVREDGAVAYFEGMCEDITERKLLENQLRQAQKMEAVGRLAGGMAHDFNNALMVIDGYTELLQPSLPEERRHEADEVLKASRRAASLIRQLLAFSRKQVIQPTVLDLNAVVADVEKMLRRLIGEDIELAIVRGADLQNVRTDRGQIEQVLINLAVNARDAMPHGGKLMIETANVTVDEGYIRQHPYAKAGEYVMLTVSDTGCGMDQDTQSHIFEPFFTTKELGKGTGLGLSTVYGIVKQSNGYISVDSEVGKGTTFRIYLPQVEASAELPAERSVSALLGGNETVLLVEDDGSLRALARRSLQSNGYTVLEAGDARAALEAARQYNGPIHLLLTDIIMPGMSGRELADYLIRARQEMRVLFMSGYTYDLIAHRGVLSPGMALVEKPFGIESLLGKVRETLDAKAA